MGRSPGFAALVTHNTHFLVKRWHVHDRRELGRLGHRSDSLVLILKDHPALIWHESGLEKNQPWKKSDQSLSGSHQQAGRKGRLSRDL